MSILVIIPAAGSGTRVGGDVPKQFRTFAGRSQCDHQLPVRGLLRVVKRERVACGLDGPA